jgi:hypothetical protein
MSAPAAAWIRSILSSCRSNHASMSAPFGLDAGARLGMRVLATVGRYPNGLRDIPPIALR